MKKLTKFLAVALMGAVVIGCGGGGSSNTPASGSLDKSFGDNGKVISGGSGDEGIYDIVSNSDGTIYVCGRAETSVAHGYDSFLSKYSENAELVSTFATNGTALSNLNKDDGCNAMAKDSGGNIYVVGFFTDSSNNKKRGYIAKYKSNGTLDTTFNGSGFLDFAQDSTVNAVAIQNGKILVAGQYHNKAVVVRLDSHGTVDSSFGNSGTVTLGNGTTDDEIKDIAIDNSGKIVIAGKTVASGNNENVAIVRLTANGQLDTSFGNNGVVIYDNNGKEDEALAVKIDSSGKIIITGYSDKAMTLAKLNSDGSLDTSFGTNGITIYSDLPYSAGADLVIDADDNILITGLSGQTGSFKMAVWRYDTNGKLDKSFNNTGVVTYDGGHHQDIGFAITIDDNNKILVGGASYQGSAKKADKAIWRINP